MMCPSTPKDWSMISSTVQLAWPMTDDQKQREELLNIRSVIPVSQIPVFIPSTTDLMDILVKGTLPICSYNFATNSLSTQRLWPCTSTSARTAVYQHAPGWATTMRNPGLPLNSDSWGGRRVFLETSPRVGKSQTGAWVFSHRHPTWIFCETIMLITTANFYCQVPWTLQEACFPTPFSVFGVYVLLCLQCHS